MPNMSKSNDKIKWSSLIIGVIFLIIAVIIFSFPVENFAAITWVIGLLSVINGILEIIYRRANKAVAGIPKGVTITMGIINIIFGLVVMFNSELTSVFFVYCFAFWIVINSLLSILISTPGERANRGLRIFSVILNILAIIFGIVLMFNPLLGIIFISVMIALSFVMFGIFNIIDALV